MWRKSKTSSILFSMEMCYFGGPPNFKKREKSCTRTIYNHQRHIAAVSLVCRGSKLEFTQTSALERRVCGSKKPEIDLEYFVYEYFPEPKIDQNKLKRHVVGLIK